MNWVYILTSQKDNKRYIGSTNDFKRRFKQHQLGQVKSTKNRRPLKLLTLAKCGSLKEARVLEKKYKGSSGKIERDFKNGFLKKRGLAQLEARTHGVREVAGSNPASPTKLPRMGTAQRALPIGVREPTKLS